MDGAKPTAITANRQTQQLSITWSDGHTAHYGFSLLRHACPCAECRGGHDNMRSDPDPLVFDMTDEDSPATHMTNLERVGAYAITIYWEDGHHYGIYNWNYLRQLCPCPECRREDSSQ
jgi:DUF971 family protein